MEKQIEKDLTEIFDEEYGKRRLITPQFTAKRLVEKGYRKQSDTAKEIFAEIYALIDNAEEKLDILFIEADDYRKGYENSVKHFRGCMDMLKKKYLEANDAESN